MFKKLHVQMTFFCTLITSLILIAMSCICLYIAESGIKKGSYPSFVNNVSSTLSHLENQSRLTHQWILEMEASYHFIIDVRDNGTPLLFRSLNRDANTENLLLQAENMARDSYDLDISDLSSAGVLSRHVEFSMYGADGTDYYVSAALIPKAKGHLSVLILYSLLAEQIAIQQQRTLFILVDIAAVLILVIFSLFFTKRMIKPIEESRKRQVQFIASASHELRSPLTVMLTSLSAMKIASPEEAENFSDVIHSEGERMSRLINDMLELANADNGSWSIHPQRIELDTLVLQTYEKYEALAKKKGLDLSITLPENTIPDCCCDGERIAQVFSILIDNAFSYTPIGGKVCLSLSVKGSEAMIRVSDNGPGIPDEEKDFIFDRFYRADRAHKSKAHFGLGLCIAKEIVKLHRGRITLEDTPGGGATFSVTLPLL